MKKYRNSIALLLALSMIVPCTAAAGVGTPVTITADTLGKYSPADIATALEYGETASGAYAKVLDDVLMPASMGIEIPHVDPSRIQQTVDVYTLDSAFAEALAAHGINRKSMTYSEYEEIENTWLLSDYVIESAKRAYPELASVDMSKWTYGKYKAYYIARDHEIMMSEIAPQQLQELAGRNIQVADLGYLLKEYHTIENVLSQPDEELKSILEMAYEFTLSKVQSEASTKDAPPSEYYSFVRFPRYNGGKGDYFHNDVLTTTEWQQVQADRALKTQQCLYDSTSTTLYCTNMYGTYSVSAKGAHEGIDFIPPSGAATPTVYAVIRGEKLAVTTYHQLSIFDEDSPDEPKTYTYYHMSSITIDDGDYVEVGDSVGKQGTEGAEGYHVHFEVHAGEKDKLASGTDHVIKSISPYRIQDYIGELDE